jgi:hypothetical protein
MLVKGASMSRDEAQDRVLKSVNQSRRAFLKRLIVGSAFVVPAVASFSMSGLSVSDANAQISNQTLIPNDEFGFLNPRLEGAQWPTFTWGNAPGGHDHPGTSIG